MQPSRACVGASSPPDPSSGADFLEAPKGLIEGPEKNLAPSLKGAGGPGSGEYYVEADNETPHPRRTGVDGSHCMGP